MTKFRRTFTCITILSYFKVKSFNHTGFVRSYKDQNSIFSWRKQTLMHTKRFGNDAKNHRHSGIKSLEVYDAINRYLEQFIVKLYDIFERREVFHLANFDVGFSTDSIPQRRCTLTD